MRVWPGQPYPLGATWTGLGVNFAIYPNKILVDPYARAIGRSVQWDDSMFGYEMHVKGFTRLHPRVPERLRGTYEALNRSSARASDAARHHGRRTDAGAPSCIRASTWSLSFFAPDLRYSASGRPAEAVHEFKRMVKALHSAGLEVILDVVYNHTAEGNHLGPTLCLRGVDNATYYRLVPDNRRYYLDFTGCGNTLNMQSPQVLQLIMDSLRYWVLEMHVDGFRFDLASALARELYEVDRLGAFFDIIHQDPILSQVKLIAEPWDLGAGGYQVGNFPVHWTEWNSKYRDATRAFWKGDDRGVAEVATRIAGSNDLYEHSGRRPYASINFTTAHDGFTLHDLMSYSQKRNLMASLLLSVGVPMISGGDEMGRTQHGNNNAYCHDSEISWTPWELSLAQQQFLAFTRRLVRFRRSQPVLMRRKYFQGRPIRGAEVKDIYWLDPSGREMTDEAWNASSVRSLGVLMVGDALDDVDERGRPVGGATLLILLNAHHADVPFALPTLGPHTAWVRFLDTVAPHVEERRYPGGTTYPLQGRTLALFVLSAEPRERPAGHADSPT